MKQMLNYRTVWLAHTGICSVITPMSLGRTPHLSLASSKSASIASRVAQRLRALYCSANCATRDSGFAPRLCHNRPRPGGLWGDAQLGRVWPIGKSLSHRAPATPVAGRAHCALTKVARCTVFPPTHWCGWLPGWMCAV